MINSKNSINNSIKNDSENSYSSNLIESLNDSIASSDSIINQTSINETTRKKNMNLFNIFKDNINKLPPDKNIIQEVKNDIKNPKDLQYYLNAIELLNSDSIKNKNILEYDYLYPHLDDKLFNVKIANKKEFAINKYIIDINEETNIEEEAKKICNKEFQLAPHQEFLRSFLSIYTPYNGILLYHGLGTGKTCSAIGIAEQTRKYLKYNNINQRIIIVASPNVQQNFRLQLFDESKLTYTNNQWNLENCVGNEIIKDLNLLDFNESKENIIKHINTLINNYYIFIGYIEFANLIIKKSKINIDKSKFSKIEINKLVKNKLENFFSNRLIIIDEIHNIRNSNDNSNKLVAQNFMFLLKNVSNIKLVLLSATPMYNDYKEIIFLLNLLNLNDRRSTIEFSDVFNSDGSFKKDDFGNEVGKELLVRKMNGYISYVKGDNPLSFPYRILPELFNKSKSIKHKLYPKIDLNNNKIDEKIIFFDLYCNQIDDYQEKVYKYIISKTFLEDLEGYNYTLLQKPLESLIISFPNEIIEKTSIEDFDDIDILPRDLVGKNGLSSIMKFDESNDPPSKYNYRFKDKKYTNIFLKENIKKYSTKIYTILNEIENSEGPVIIYSQFIDGGIIPMTLALESMGMVRYGNQKNLFSDEIISKIDPIDSITYKKKSQVLLDNDTFNPAKYILITGDKKLTPNLKNDLKACTNIDNIQGKNIKVVLLTMAGSEGIDFKFIRQVHILEPWYNINRIEQIIGRAVRTCSHRDLEFKKRNVKIYMHTTLLNDKKIESVDNLLYRKSEKKAIQIGIITRLLKENSVDCHLNSDLMKMTEKNLNKYFKEGFNLTLSNNEIIKYNIGDKSNSVLCDYMKSCEYNCSNKEKLIKDYDSLDLNTFNEKHMDFFNSRIIKEIYNLFKDKYVYNKIEFFTILNNKKFPNIVLQNVLKNLIDSKNAILQDKYNNSGYLVNIDDLYIFQPKNISNEKSSLFTKMNPHNQNIDYINYKVPDEIKKFVPVKIVNDFEKTNSVNIDRVNSIFEILLERYNNIINLNKEYDNALDKNSNDKLLMNFLNIEKNNSNLFINYSETSDNKYEINYTIIKTIIIHMLLDSLKLDELINLFKITYFKKHDESQKFDILFLNTIKKYFNDNILSKRKKVLVLPFKNQSYNFSLYIINLEEDSISLKIGEYVDYKEFEELLNEKYYLNYKEYGDIVGFIYNINEYNYSIKLKTLKDKKIPNVYNDGTICNNLSKKEIKTRFIENILSKETYEKLYKSKFYKTPSYCLIIEIFLRYLNIINYDNKVWFLNKSYTLFNNFIKID